MFPPERVILILNIAVYKHIFALPTFDIAPYKLNHALERSCSSLQSFSVTLERLCGGLSSFTGALEGLSHALEKPYHTLEESYHALEKSHYALEEPYHVLERLCHALERLCCALEKSDRMRYETDYPSSASALRVTTVAPQPPASGGASAKCSTKGVRASTLRTVSRCTPTPLPWMMRN